MKEINKCLLLLAVFTSVLMKTVSAQQPPFWNEIQAFKKEDSIKPPPRNAILFTGSSSFRLWKEVQKDFPGYAIINRAFGGSSLPDVIRYASEIILPYQPKQVFIYCGDNDLASSDTITAQTVVQRFQQLFFIIRKALPTTSIVYVSIKPSPSRRHLMPKAEAANEGIKKFLKTQKKTGFVDIYHPMLTPSRQPIPDLFLEDSLHMNRKGYLIWQKALKPYLLK